MFNYWNHDSHDGWLNKGLKTAWNKYIDSSLYVSSRRFTGFNQLVYFQSLSNSDIFKVMICCDRMYNEDFMEGAAGTSWCDLALWIGTVKTKMNWLNCLATKKVTSLRDQTLGNFTLSILKSSSNIALKIMLVRKSKFCRLFLIKNSDAFLILLKIFLILLKIFSGS